MLRQERVIRELRDWIEDEELPRLDRLSSEEMDRELADAIEGKAPDDDDSSTARAMDWLAVLSETLSWVLCEPLRHERTHGWLVGALIPDPDTHGRSGPPEPSPN